MFYVHVEPIHDENSGSARQLILIVLFLRDLVKLVGRDRLIVRVVL